MGEPLYPTISNAVCRDRALNWERIGIVEMRRAMRVQTQRTILK